VWIYTSILLIRLHGVVLNETIDKSSRRGTKVISGTDLPLYCSVILKKVEIKLISSEKLTFRTCLSAHF